ncbi:MAG: MFS transporter, partial [Asticcacaulis sp.]
AMTYAAATFSQKLGGALASYLIGAGLKAVDYVANGPQTVETKGIITVLMSLAPAVAALISVGVLLMYKLDKASMSAVSTELARRRAALEE